MLKVYLMGDFVVVKGIVTDWGVETSATLSTTIISSSSSIWTTSATSTGAGTGLIKGNSLGSIIGSTWGLGRAENEETKYIFS